MNPLVLWESRQAGGEKSISRGGLGVFAVPQVPLEAGFPEEKLGGVRGDRGLSLLLLHGSCLVTSGSWWAARRLEVTEGRACDKRA